MKRTTTLFSLLLLLQLFPQVVQAQEKDTTAHDGDDLMAMLADEPGAAKKEYTIATFKTTRIANGHSIENVGKGILDLRINHRFGQLNAGVKEFFGLDNATTRIGLDYGITDWLMVGIGRSTFMKDVDGFVKVKLLRQTENNGMPVSVSYMGAVSAQDVKLLEQPEGADYPFSNRVAYVNQLLIARKFSNWLSLQLMPTHVHYNFVQFRDEPNDVFAMGVGGRIKLTNRIAFTGEYYMLLGDKMRNTRNSLTLGFDIETGGHVFQLMFTNSTGITERTVIGQTTGRWEKGDIHFGFNISRIFTIVRPKEFRNTRNKIW
ncbi:DUF5777 family beta-barrel protein [Taibaiella helva]|uniref:DUF5777 family beta-barrel protein n=1 Tax=Taibaiella helva TaxID=2301235 RepID=UPI0013005B37|nr:DUF5777 family beta-barrel protein [Taibaiella helva]